MQDEWQDDYGNEGVGPAWWAECNSTFLVRMGAICRVWRNRPTRVEIWLGGLMDFFTFFEWIWV